MRTLAAVSRVLFFLSAITAGVEAQTLGTISGTVKDRTGAALPGVSIEAQQMPTGMKRMAESDADGRFAIPNLPASTYQLKLERTGFRASVQRGIELTVADTVALDLVMEVGTFEQTITVDAQVGQVQVSTSDLSFLVHEKSIEQLPLNGRNYTDLALLQPGVVSFPNRDGGSVVAHGLAMSFDGQDPRSNVYLLDGTPQNDFTNGPAGSAASTALGMEAVREFRVELNAYSAEFGRSPGGQITALTKSGGNDIHGSLFWYLRNDNFDARNFFDQAKPPEFQRNQAGGSLGGPVIRQKTFYFVTYEALREKLGKTVTTVTPDENARLGILPTGAVPVSPLVKPYLDEYPLPNGPSLGGGLARYFFGFNQTLREDFGQARLDHYFNDRNQSFARYTIDDADQHLPTDFPQFPRSFLSRNQFATAEHRYLGSASTSHTLRLNFSRTRIGQDIEANTSKALAPFIPGRSLMGDIDIGGVPRFGPQSSVNVKLTQNIYGVDYGVTHQERRHLLKAGALIERYQDNMVNPTFSLGIHTFNDLSSFLQGRSARFIGLPPGGPIDRYWRFTLFGFYLQDQFRLSRRLVLNAGVRHEFSTMPVDIYGRDSALPNLYDPQPTAGPLYRNPTYLNIMPRAGFAWDLFGDGRASLRGSYGLFFNTNNQQHLIVTVTNPPATPRVSISNPAFPQPDFSKGAGNSMRPIDYNIQTPKIQVYHLDLERQLPWETVLSVGYAGSRGTRLWRSGDWNIVEPVRLSDGTLFFPAGGVRRNRSFSTIELKSSDGDSWYNAMLVEVRKRFRGSLAFQSSYTYSRNIDTTQASTFFSDSTSGTTSAMPEFPGFHYNKGLADYHAKHNSVTSLIWQIPAGRDLSGFSALLATGWQLSGILTIRSGQPLTLFTTRNRSRSLWQPSIAPGTGFDRPSMAPGFTYESAIAGRPEQWFTPAAFLLQPAGTLGTMGRGSLMGPNLQTLDLSAAKSFSLRRLSERTAIQFRAEAFNILNRANFGPPSLIAFAGDADNEKPLSSLGLIRNTVTSSRQIQVALRLSF